MTNRTGGLNPFCRGGPFKQDGLFQGDLRACPHHQDCHRRRARRPVDRQHRRCKPAAGTGHRADDLQQCRTGLDLARDVSHTEPRRGTGLRGSAPGARSGPDQRSQRNTVLRCCSIDRPDHRDVRVADGWQRHHGARAELPVRSGQHRQAYAKVHRSPDCGRSGSRSDDGVVQRDSAVDPGWSGAATRRWHGANPAAQRRSQAARAAGRSDHTTYPCLGPRRAARRTAPHPSVVPDPGPDLVVRLQRHLFGRGKLRRLQDGCRRLGQHREPVGRQLCRLETQAGRRRCASTGRRRPRLERACGQATDGA